MDERRAEVTARHDMQRAERDRREQPEAGTITPQYLTACMRDALAGMSALAVHPKGAAAEADDFNVSTSRRLTLLGPDPSAARSRPAKAVNLWAPGGV